MHHSARRAVVFTPLVPSLDAFLKSHVHPENPLRHHPLWLSDVDLSKLKNVSINKSNRKVSDDRSVDGPLPTVLVEVPSTLFLYNLDQLPPGCDVRWQLPQADVPMSVSSTLPYNHKMCETLDKVRQRNNFESNWWGTRAAWGKRGVQMDPTVRPTPVLFSRLSQFLHISFLTNADELLRNSYISGKTGALITWMDSETNESHYEEMRKCVTEHMQEHKFLSPLYFSESALQSAGICIRPNARPLQFASTSNAAGYVANERFTLKHQVAVYQQYYHLSQIRFPDGYKIPPETITAERQSPGEPIHGPTGRVLRFPELRPDAIVYSSSPELSSVVWPSHNGINDNAACAAHPALGVEHPNGGEGRNLWYLPQDILGVGGTVHPNAMPVEVSIESESMKKRRVYNVEQLVVPLDGYKAVGCIATLKRFEQDEYQRPTSTLTEERGSQHTLPLP
uniref:Uncharacterized protein n=1 Tax=Trypanosoma congolense (strain IL3000) TaxID=1068625 RepID=G0URN2_TRYCI|nr:conserved hypothetical protein [Trypanosoma congolense IL3000]